MRFEIGIGERGRGNWGEFELQRGKSERTRTDRREMHENVREEEEEEEGKCLGR